MTTMSRIRRFAAVALTIHVALACAAAPAMATSAGFYGSAGLGSASWEDGGGWNGDRDGDTQHVGAGLALEMPTGFFRLSYRLGLGWERIESEGDNGGADQTLEGFVVDQDLTYDLYASPSMRFWIGPELRLGFFDGSFDNVSGGDRNYFAAGIGPVLGFDFALNPSVALSWKLGYLFTWYTTEDDPWGDGSYPGNHEPYAADDSIEEGHAFTSLSILFRLWGGPPPGPHPPVYQPQGRW
jgi:hypothetical protein